MTTQLQIIIVKALVNDPFIMLEKGPGISILPCLILKRHSYDIVVKPLDVPPFRRIGVAVKNWKELSPAARRFPEFLDCREEGISENT